MQLFLIRHAQSTNNVLTDESLRSYDPGLTELGFKQAKCLAEHLANSSDIYSEQPSGYTFDVIYTSAMYRTLLTIRPVAAALCLCPQIWVDVHETGGIYLDITEEVSVGYPGMTRAEIHEQFPNYVLPDNVTEKGWWHIEVGRENDAAVEARALRVVAQLRMRATSHERIAIMSHGAFIDRILKVLFNQPIHGPISYAHYNTAITRLDFFADGHFMLHYLNRVDHLPPQLRSH